MKKIILLAIATLGLISCSADEPTSNAPDTTIIPPDTVVAPPREYKMLIKTYYGDLAYFHFKTKTGNGDWVEQTLASIVKVKQGDSLHVTTGDWYRVDELTTFQFQVNNFSDNWDTSNYGNNTQSFNTPIDWKIKLNFPENE